MGYNYKFIIREVPWTRNVYVSSSFDMDESIEQKVWDTSYLLRREIGEDIKKFEKQIDESIKSIIKQTPLKEIIKVKYLNKQDNGNETN